MKKIIYGIVAGIAISIIFTALIIMTIFMVPVLVCFWIMICAKIIINEMYDWLNPIKEEAFEE